MNQKRICAILAAVGLIVVGSRGFSWADDVELPPTQVVTVFQNCTWKAALVRDEDGSGPEVVLAVPGAGFLHSIAALGGFSLYDGDPNGGGRLLMTLSNQQQSQVDFNVRFTSGLY